MENIFENSKYKIVYTHDKKLVEFYMKDIEIEKLDIIEMHTETLRLTDGKKYVSVFSAKDFFSITGEARAEGAKPHYSKNLIAQALVVKNLAQRLIGNFIMKINKPASETKMFAEHEEAKLWVSTKVAEYETAKKNNANTVCV